MSDLYCMANARNAEQLAAMHDYEARGLCVMCSPDEIVESTSAWYAVRNRWPYKGTSSHFLLTPRYHVTSIMDLPGPYRQEMFSCLQLLMDRGLVGNDFGLAMRNGDPAKSGATIWHLHAHVIEGDGSGPVKVKLVQ